MSVQFTASQEPIGWQTGCPFDDQVFPTFARARQAAAAHPVGGCAAGKAFFFVTSFMAEREAYAAEDEVHEHTGLWAPECVWAHAMWTQPVYAEESPRVPFGMLNQAEALRCLGLTTGVDALDDLDDLDASPVGLGELLAASCPQDVAWCGRIAAEDLLGRVMLASALLPAGTPQAAATAVTGGDSPTVVIYGGRDADYMAERLNQLAELAYWAAERSLDIVWS